ncbi:MAG: ribose 5-phosphate isomerase B [Bdellovibrionaceae bacterium]|nr:ribose 5-phosphate isomerase B [Pseudobdellovibrionaceae bacterium]
MPKKIFIANDHAAVSLKKFLIKEFPNYEWHNLGTDNENSVDYPDFAIELGKKMLDDKDSIGLLICGSGQGMAITANKFAYIRAALCWNTEVAKLAREHNNANVLCLGARLLSPNEAKEIFKTFINTAFAGGRHENRVQKISKYFN